MHPQRRSGRIARELPIVLLGADTAGKVFAEETKTVVLSRHGAGIVSRYKFAPDEVLTLRLAGSSREAEVRLVGQIGGEPDCYVYGVAFLDPNLEFWPMDFPPPESFEVSSRRVTLACSFCGSTETVEPDDIEEDVYAVNGNVLRYCARCGGTTPWIKARGEGIRSPLASPPAAPPPPPLNLPSIPHSPQSHRPAQLLVSSPPAPASAYSRDLEPALAATSESAAYVATALDTLPTGSVESRTADFSPVVPATQEAKPSSTINGASSARPTDAAGKPMNRRKHMRVPVDFTACVRQGESGDDLVECTNVSKGGLCFQSRKRYALDSTVEVAAPYSPGEPALFVPAKIRRCEPLGDGGFFRYGVAYLPRANDSTW